MLKTAARALVAVAIVLSTAACGYDASATFNPDGSVAVGLKFLFPRSLMNGSNGTSVSGFTPSDIASAKVHATFVANLRFAAEMLGAAGIKLLIEPINTFDIPGFFLSRSRQALDVMRDVGSSNLYLQYDIYHMQRMEGELANTIKAHLPQIAHLQLADNPGRNEPGTGEINYRFLFGFIDSIGYEGWIGCEYKPKGKTIDGLGWRAAHGV